MMTKEHVIDTYGTVRYTIGSGCSGGSLVQQQVANAYPGLYQGDHAGRARSPTRGRRPTSTWTTSCCCATSTTRARWAPGVAVDPVEMAAVEGHLNPANAVTFTTVIPSSRRPEPRSCPGVAPEDVYDAQTNPDGVRCSLQDYMVNVFGVRPEDGIARRPYDNVGVQYGLKALLDGADHARRVRRPQRTSSAAGDIDFNESRRSASPADPKALERVYKSGAINQGDNLDQVAIIDLRGPDPGAFHDVYRTYTMRARLEREHGTAANQVLWRGQVPLLGDADYADEAIFAVDRWLAAVEADKRKVPLARKIIEDKPEDVADRCTNGAGVRRRPSATATPS